MKATCESEVSECRTRMHKRTSQPASTCKESPSSEASPRRSKRIRKDSSVSERAKLNIYNPTDKWTNKNELQKVQAVMEYDTPWRELFRYEADDAEQQCIQETIKEFNGLRDECGEMGEYLRVAFFLVDQLIGLHRLTDSFIQEIEESMGKRRDPPSSLSSLVLSSAKDIKPDSGCSSRSLGSAPQVVPDRPSSPVTDWDAWDLTEPTMKFYYTTDQRPTAEELHVMFSRESMEDSDRLSGKKIVPELEICMSSIDSAYMRTLLLDFGRQSKIQKFPYLRPLKVDNGAAQFYSTAREAYVFGTSMKDVGGAAVFGYAGHKYGNIVSTVYSGNLQARVAGDILAIAYQRFSRLREEGNMQAILSGQPELLPESTVRNTVFYIVGTVRTVRLVSAFVSNQYLEHLQRGYLDEDDKVVLRWSETYRLHVPDELAEATKMIMTTLFYLAHEWKTKQHFWRTFRKDKRNMRY